MFDLFSRNTTKDITPQDAKKNMESDSSIVLLDVRTEDEHKNIRIKNSINIPLDRIDDVSNKISDKNTTIYVYCLSGGRSSKACSKLSKMEYSNVFNLGGINSWPYEKVTN